jgi:hypothetical protein
MLKMFKMRLPVKKLWLAQFLQQVLQSTQNSFLLSEVNAQSASLLATHKRLNL